MARAWRRRVIAGVLKRGDAEWDAGPARRSWEQLQDGVYCGLGVVGFDGDADVGLAVGFAAAVVEGGEGEGIAGQGSVGGLGDAPLNGVEGAVEPDGDAAAAEEIAVGGDGE